MVNARHKVLAYLHKTRTASARQISRALRMPAANIRHHLRVLVSDGRLEVSGGGTGEKRGRPEKVYLLPRAVLGDNLSALSEALLAESGSKVRMDVLAKHLVGESDLANQPAGKRLNLVIEKLNQMNYHARWEAGSSGPRIILSHCPYASIIARHPELCVMDAALLEKLTEQSAQQLTKIGRDGSLSCVFALMHKP